MSKSISEGKNEDFAAVFSNWNISYPALVEMMRNRWPRLLWQWAHQHKMRGTGARPSAFLTNTTLSSERSPIWDTTSSIT